VQAVGKKKVWQAASPGGQHGIMFRKLEILLPDLALDGPNQMALDEFLLSSVAVPTLRFYQWESRCVSFGYFQEIAEVRPMYPGIPLVRRWTGGGIVEHGEDLTFSLMIPRGEPVAAMPPVLFYRALHQRLAFLLSARTPGEIRLVQKLEASAGSRCFQAAAVDDLVVEKRKILGGALRRSHGALLYQGSLQGLGKSLDDVGLFGSFLAETSSRFVTIERLPDSQHRTIANLVSARYGSTEWLERR
jgi:lipoyl(octanoyl) transferase